MQVNEFLDNVRESETERDKNFKSEVNDIMNMLHLQQRLNSINTNVKVFDINPDKFKVKTKEIVQYPSIE